MSVQSGWGRFTWGRAYWNADSVLATGWGAKAWNDGEWGELNDITLTLTGQSLTSSIGSVTVSAEINTGWGQDGLGVENFLIILFGMIFHPLFFSLASSI